MFELSKRSIGKTKVEIDVLGLGCAPLGGNFVDLSYNQAAEIIKFALDSGIKYFDTAPWYGFGRSERVVGDQLRKRQFVISPREQIFEAFISSSKIFLFSIADS